MAADRLRVNELFRSIQGEGSRCGLPCTFVRLTGCHLRCTYCDTEYAFYEGAWMSLAEVVTRIDSLGRDFVEITGGEPLLQPAVYPLMQRLLDRCETVALETSGAVSIAQVDPRVVRIVDLKTPSSGECDRNLWENLEHLTPRDEIKFVIGTRADYEWSRERLKQHDLARSCTVLFSPVIGTEGAAGLKLYRGGIEPHRLAEWILADRLPVRYSLQVHKFIWDPTARGV